MASGVVVQGNVRRPQVEPAGVARPFGQDSFQRGERVGFQGEPELGEPLLPGGPLSPTWTENPE